MAAQDAIIQNTGHLYFGSELRVLPTSDQGWAVYEPDGFKLFRFNSCGKVEWAKKFNLPATNYSGLDFFIPTRKGGFAFLNLAPGPNRLYSQITVVDNDGSVLWSKLISDPNYSLTSYSIGQDQYGNFFIYANASKIGGGEVALVLTKLSETGVQLWSRFYSRGGIWGGAINTWDNGYLLRSGQSLIKTDSLGQVVWTKTVNSGSGNYITPLEVEDGYIFPSFTNNLYRTALFKLNKDGTPAPSGCRSFHQEIWGSSKFPFLRKSAGGKIAGLFNVDGLPTAVQFDKNLNVISSHSIRTNAMMIINGMDACFSDDERLLVSGILSIGDFAFFPQVFITRSNPDLSFSCDTVASVVTFPDASAVQTVSTSSVLHPMQVTSQTVLVENLTDETFQFCGAPPTPLSVQIEGDSVVCSAAKPVTLSLKSATSFDSVLWSDGSDKTTLSVSKPGKYWVRTFDNCRKEAASDTLVVKESDFPEIPWTQKFSLCDADGFMLKAEVPGATYRWQDGSTSSSFQASNPGVYSVNIMLDGCEKVLQTEIEDCEILDIPNLFTPDGNALNERFVSGKMKGIRNQHLEIFNRWGQKIHESNDFKTEGWDGKTSLPGVYFWSLSYTNFKGESKTKTGIIEKQ
jgi:gliding motility-associated-like protein